jgi:hypothetical protein
MGTILSKGYKLPATGDRDWYDQLEFNITRQNAHKHDGTDAEKITPNDLNKLTSTLTAASAVALGGGNFKHTVTVPGSLNIDNAEFKVYQATGAKAGVQVFPTITKISGSQIEVFHNDNTVDYVIIYG